MPVNLTEIFRSCKSDVYFLPETVFMTSDQYEHQILNAYLKQHKKTFRKNLKAGKYKGIFFLIDI